MPGKRSSFDRSRKLAGILFVALIAIFSASSVQAVVFFSPSPYLSSADIPAAFYAGGAPTALEDFEDDDLDFGIVVNPEASILGPNLSGFRDSVDADDGAIDGSGSDGHALVLTARNDAVDFILIDYSGVNFGGVMGALPTAAGVVWTDGLGTARSVIFEAFGPGMVSLGSIGPFALNDGNNKGETAEDRFFGVQQFGGILALKITDTSDNFEVDHVQYGTAVPEPSTILLWGLGLAGLGFTRRRLR